MRLLCRTEDPFHPRTAHKCDAAKFACVRFRSGNAPQIYHHAARASGEVRSHKAVKRFRRSERVV